MEIDECRVEVNSKFCQQPQQKHCHLCRQMISREPQGETHQVSEKENFSWEEREVSVCAWKRNEIMGNETGEQNKLPYLIFIL